MSNSLSIAESVPMVSASLEVDFLVAGAGHAASVFARSMRELGFSGSILLVGQEIHLPYERPALSKEVLRDPGYEHAPILNAPEWENLRVQLLLGRRVISVNGTDHSACLDEGTIISWGRLVIATGARPRRLPGPSHAARHVIRTIDDALAIRARLRQRPDASVVIVGAGPIGLEAAASLRPFAASITVIEAADQVMNRVAPVKVSEAIAKSHRDNDVSLLLKATVATIVDRGEALDIGLDTGQLISADLLIEGIGVVPEELLIDSPALISGSGIIVDDRYATAHPAIFAIGDAAHPPAGRQETWAHAESSGRAAARSVLDLDPGVRPIPSFWSDQFSRIQIAGDTVGATEAGHHGDAHLFQKAGTIVAAAAIGAPRDFTVARRLIGKPVQFIQ
jgi:3-phenylpropionate/trans-cinnamate dioxygenase ferredoxin reductase subunit